MLRPPASRAVNRLARAAAINWPLRQPDGRCIPTAQGLPTRTDLARESSSTRLPSGLPPPDSVPAARCSHRPWPTSWSVRAGRQSSAALPRVLKNRRGRLREDVSGNPRHLVGQRPHAGQLSQLQQCCTFTPAQPIRIGQHDCFLSLEPNPAEPVLGELVFSMSYPPSAIAMAGSSSAQRRMFLLRSAVVKAINCSIVPVSMSRLTA